VSPPPSSALPQLVPSRRAAPPPFTHPLFAGRRQEPAAAADCSRAALSRLAERVRSIDRELGPATYAGAERSLRETREELIPRAAACVGQDGPLDVPWEMLHSAALSLEICTDARQSTEERTRRCRRAVDVAGRAEQGG
jgi:hypothetical protein